MDIKQQESPIDTLLKTESIKYVVASALGIIAFLVLRLGEEVVKLYNLASLPETGTKVWVLSASLLGMLFLLSSFLAFRFYQSTIETA